MVHPIPPITDPPPRPPRKAAPVADDPLDDPMLLAFSEVLGEELAKVRDEVAQGVLAEIERSDAKATALLAAMTAVDERVAHRIAGALEEFKRFATEQREAARAEVLDLANRLKTLAPQLDLMMSSQTALEVELELHGHALKETVASEVANLRPTLAQDVRAQVQDDLAPKLIEIERSATVAVQAAIPAPRDGRDGRDGKDGKDGSDGKDGAAGMHGYFDEPNDWAGQATRGAIITHRSGTWYAMRDTAAEPAFEHRDWHLICDGVFRAELEQGEPGELAVVLELSSGQLKRQTVRVPGNVYRGVWTRRAYQAGDSVTHQGSTWITERDTEARPGDEDSGWRLAVKRGADGKDGLSIEFRGIWAAGAKYKPGDVTKAPGGAYIALRNTSAAPPLRTERNDDWQLIVPFPVAD